jgi:hypothetical protein
MALRALRCDRLSCCSRRTSKSSGNAPWRSFTSGSSPSPSRSWPGRERDRLPSRSALLRFLSALTEARVSVRLASIRDRFCSCAASHDWSRRYHRRVCMQLLRHQHVEVRVEQSLSANPTFAPAPLSRTQRAHSRLSWTERLARNTRGRSAPAVALTLFGVPSATAHILGLGTI